MALTQTRLAKVSNFAEEKTDLFPSVRTCKISTFYKDESTHLRDL